MGEYTHTHTDTYKHAFSKIQSMAVVAKLWLTGQIGPNVYFCKACKPRMVSTYLND